MKHMCTLYTVYVYLNFSVELHHKSQEEARLLPNDLLKGVCWVQNAHSFRGFVALDLAQRTATQFGYVKTTSSSSGHGLGLKSLNCYRCATKHSWTCATSSFYLTRCVRASMARAMMAMEMWIRSKLSTLTDKNEPWTTTRGGKYRIQIKTERLAIGAIRKFPCCSIVVTFFCCRNQLERKLGMSS